MRALTAFSLLPICLASTTLQAQSHASADILIGRVTDVTGRPVADAQIGATAIGSGLTRSISTDADGRYKLFFPETARQYVVLAKHLGFSPVRRTITRRTNGPEEMRIDIELGGAPLALSMVEVNGESDGSLPPETMPQPPVDATVPNPVAEILALKDTLRLSAVQMVGLTDLADTLQAKNTRIYKNIRTLLAKSRESGDVQQVTGSVAMMLEEASGNTATAVSAAGKLLRPEQLQILPQVIRDQVLNIGTNAVNR